MCVMSQLCALLIWWYPIQTIRQTQNCFAWSLDETMLREVNVRFMGGKVKLVVTSDEL